MPKVKAKTMPRRQRRPPTRVRSQTQPCDRDEVSDADNQTPPSVPPPVQSTPESQIAKLGATMQEMMAQQQQMFVACMHRSKPPSKPFSRRQLRAYLNLALRHPQLICRLPARTHRYSQLRPILPLLVSPPNTFPCFRPNPYPREQFERPEPQSA